MNPRSYELKSAQECAKMADEALLPSIVSIINFEIREGKRTARVDLSDKQEAFLREKLEPLGFIISHVRGKSWTISWDV